MSEASEPLTGPELSAGVPISQIPDGEILLGRVNDEAVLLARHGNDIFALGAKCTHYGGPLAEGLLVGHELRCPWHHACFDIRTGEASQAPALNPIKCWKVERDGDKVVVREPRPAALPPMRAHGPDSVVIIGAGAAGNAAAEMLRREGYAGSVTLIGAEHTVPVDRPNLSKDYLAGTAPEEWIPLRDREFYASTRIDLLLGERVIDIDANARQASLAGGRKLSYGALLLATGADPVKLSIPGADKPQVHYLRSLEDSRAIVAKTASARRAVVVGASFIGLEVAASLRARDIEVHVVAPESRPLERVMGPRLGDFIRSLHEEHGVHFHLGQTLASVDEHSVTLSNAESLDADLVVVGIGVRPAVALAERAGLKLDRGVVVDRHLQTSFPGIYAAGDIARWPDAETGKLLRVEHWVVAERQGQVAARNILGRREPFFSVPFFWSQHYDVVIAYVGHAENWDRIDVIGNIAQKDCALAYVQGGKIIAVASIFRDKDSLAAEAAFERHDQRALQRMFSNA